MDTEEITYGGAGGEFDESTFSSHVADIVLADAEAIYRAAKHPKSFISLDGADHLLTGARDTARVAHLVAVWADPYLPETFTPEID